MLQTFKVLSGMCVSYMRATADILQRQMTKARSANIAGPAASYSDFALRRSLAQLGSHTALSG